MEEDHNECPFCNLGDRVILDNTYANMFASNPRKVEGHVLVTPERHIEKPWEVSSEELLAIFGLVRIAQKILADEYDGGVDTVQNYRPFMAQDGIKTNHLHYHVYPRAEEDELWQAAEKQERELFRELSDDELLKIKELFKQQA